MGVEHSGKINYGCNTYNAKVLERIVHSGIR